MRDHFNTLRLLFIQSVSAVAKVRSWHSQRTKACLFLLFASVFSFGVYYSLDSLTLSLSDISLQYVLVVFALAFISVFLNAIEMQLCALAVGCSMQRSNAVFISSVATLMNILPLPGSTLVRAAALHRLGISFSSIGKVLLAAALMWLFMAIIAAIVVMPTYQWSYGLTGLSVLVLLCTVAWVIRNSSIWIAVGFLLSRLCMLLVFMLRIYVLLAALGLNGAFEDAVVLSLAAVVGSAVSIVPAGIGVTESFGALLANWHGSSPTAAFLVLSLNRIIGYVSNAIVIGAYGMFRADIFLDFRVKREL